MDAYVHLRNVFRDGWLERLLTDDFRRVVRDDDVAYHIREVARESRAPDPLSKLLHVELMTYLPNDILQKVDIASMAFGLEVRVPFLDHHVVELVASMPIWAKLTPFRQKAVLRDAFGAALPVHTLRKRKQGFHLPVGAWFRGRGERILRDTVLSTRALSRGYFEDQTVAALVNEHLSGAADHGAKLWTLLQLEVWHQRYVDAPVA
jgi:asparagine synthase (glutamine-hydrolysing)